MPDRTITLITGANKGLGYETARRLRDAGHTVYIGARDPQRGQTAADELGVDFIPIDVTDNPSIASAAQRMREREGRLDVLINNAGIPGPRKNVPDLLADDARAVLETNVVSIVGVTHAFLPLLRESARPVIVDVSSGMGSFSRVQDPQAVEHGRIVPLYQASKAAVNMLSFQYALALPDIRVNIADPGFTATDFNDHRGTQTVTQGTDAIVALATLGPEGPTGTFSGHDGTVEW